MQRPAHQYSQQPYLQYPKTGNHPNVCPSASEWTKQSDMATELNTTKQQKWIINTWNNISQNTYAEWKKAD